MLTSLQHAKRCDELIRVLRNAGCDWRDLVRLTSSIVLFGSRATGDACRHSDWDVICVGKGPRLIGPQLDVVWVDSTIARKQLWLGSELAAHARHYGVVLHGMPEWMLTARTGSHALGRKERRISVRAAPLLRIWSTMPEPFRVRQRCLIRRDLQRAACLAAEMPVPPTARLDDAWSRWGDENEALSSVLAATQLPATVRETISMLFHRTGVRQSSES